MEADRLDELQERDYEKNGTPPMWKRSKEIQRARRELEQDLVRAEQFENKMEEELTDPPPPPPLSLLEELCDAPPPPPDKCDSLDIWRILLGDIGAWDNWTLHELIYGW
jgi:hypothetical protein